jgi:glycosyltransferase involved in cell wall biosynthesis
METRLVVENRQGLSRARNKALWEATGDVFLFTDDDVRFPENWIEEMTAPIRDGHADAVAGGVRLAPHLRRSWMKEIGTGLFAETRGIDPESPDRMVGANMAFARHVTESVPGFDPALGAGALGMKEETLFSRQLLRAGYDIESAFDVVVEHHCDPSRLTRSSLIKMNEKLGRSNGYVAYHWHHSVPTNAHISFGVDVGMLFLRLQRERLKQVMLNIAGTVKSQAPTPPHEQHLIRRSYYRLQIVIEMGSCRHYEMHGLRRMDYNYN